MLEAYFQPIEPITASFHAAVLADGRIRTWGECVTPIDHDNSDVAAAYALREAARYIESSLRTQPADRDDTAIAGTAHRRWACDAVDAAIVGRELAAMHHSDHRRLAEREWRRQLTICDAAAICFREHETRDRQHKNYASEDRAELIRRGHEKTCLINAGIERMGFPLDDAAAALAFLAEMIKKLEARADGD